MPLARMLVVFEALKGALAHDAVPTVRYLPGPNTNANMGYLATGVNSESSHQVASLVSKNSKKSPQ